MSIMTQCVSHPSRLPSSGLSLGRIFRVLAALTIALLFMVAHLKLRFGVNEMRAKTLDLQKECEDLQANTRLVVAQNASLTDPMRLREYARGELGMMPVSQTDKDAPLVLSRETTEKYALARSARQQPPLTPEERKLQQQEEWLAAFGERVGLMANAQASPRD